MKRSIYYNFIEEKLSELATRLKVRAAGNILDYHIHLENFCLYLLNLLYDWNLENRNITEPNGKGYDLIDKSKNIIVQVTATTTPAKINSALQSASNHYPNYHFKFIAISTDAKNLKNLTYKNYNLQFSRAEDIIDIPTLMKQISSIDIERQKKIHEFIKKELGSNQEIIPKESNLTAIILILSQENLRSSQFETLPYEIESKISFNQLNNARLLIDEHKIHCNRIEKIYSEFDEAGANKSLSVLNAIRSIYVKIPNSASADELFNSIIEKVIEKVHSSSNYDNNMAEEELELYVQLLVVDAFIRCKIFERPTGDAPDAHP